MKGHFISFEGIDGCGKSTQIQLLRQYLEKRNIGYVAVSDPGGTELGSKLRQLILGRATTNATAYTELLLFTACRVELVDKVIKPQLELGKWVLSDRFVDSSRAYQGGGAGLGIDLITRLQEMVLPQCTPDKTLLYQISPATARMRLGGKDNIDDFENRHFNEMRTIGESYQKIANLEPQRICCIDAEQSIELVHKHTVDVIEKLCNE